MTNTVTFNVCNDNAAAAAEMVKRLKRDGHQAELLEIPETPGHDLSHEPAALRHNVGPEIAVPMMVEIEKAFTTAPAAVERDRDQDRDQDRDRFRSGSSSPMGPFGGPDPRAQGQQPPQNDPNAPK